MTKLLTDLFTRLFATDIQVNRKFQVFKQEHPYSPMPYRVVEVIETSDGPRSRVCEGCYFTAGEAIDKIVLFSGEPKDPNQSEMNF